MSSFYDDASLVMIPSGYKNAKIYCEKPTDGSGDLTFTRASNATRVASNGLIEKVRTNQVFESETFDSGTWGKSLVTITANFDTAPNGTLTADRFVSAGGAFPQIAQTRTVVSGTQYTASIYVKSDGTAQIAQAILIGGASASFTPTTSWQRVAVTFTASAGTASFVLATNSATSPASSFVIWGAQLETGDIATDYIPTTTAAVSVGPVSGLPRLDYLNSSCPRLLLEPQRTNLQLNSESFDNATWTKTNSVVTANQIASPDGYINADKLDETTANNIHQLESSRTVTAATYTMSVFAKKGERNFVRLYEDTTLNSAYFNLNTGVVGTVSGPSASAKIENYGNGWYRCSLTYTETGTFGRYRIVVAKQDNETSYAGTAGYGIYIYGAQYELGAYATSYIPTLGTSVTRVADVTTKTGISSLIGSTEGVLFVEADMKLNSATNRIFIDVNDNGLTNRALINISNNVIGGFVQGATRVSYTIPSSGRYKIAFGYKSGDFVLYVNGVQRSTSSASVTFSGMNQLFLGHAFADGTTQPSDPIAQALLFKTRLSNSTLARLTQL